MYCRKYHKLELQNKLKIMSHVMIFHHFVILYYTLQICYVTFHMLHVCKRTCILHHLGVCCELTT